MGETIICADDEPRFLRLLKLFLGDDGYEIIAVSGGAEVLAALGRRPDASLVILDVMMPGMDGYATCLAIREFSRVPLLMLTALGDEAHEIRGIDGGADDYVSKPFSRELLRTRVRALLRRGRGEEPERLEAGEVSMDASSREVLVAGEAVVLSFREFELLRCLLRNKEAVCARDRILDLVWGRDYDGDPRTLDTHVKSLRKKLGAGGRHIVTVRNVGYSFKEAPS